MIISAVSLIYGLEVFGRTILTEGSSEDFARRIENQPEIASRFRLPANLSQEEADAMKFLYAYMSTPDILDYSPDFYVENIRLSLQADREMPWGKSVPDREWRHFVLPVRVNNENLDISRKVFYDELKERVKGLSMEEAILEVNHWCHEKVSYQPSDARTSSPLATVCNALGRCGEESTFTVAALRSVGIPARQVYTPRWAHTDDNHAWVEAWADGKWHFLGACEPEAVLDLAWFNAPAARGMLMTTKVTGAYDGPEEQLEFTPITTIINVTENYAPVERSSVTVTDTEMNPVENVKVRFSLYNYAEFYPLAVKTTDSRGEAHFTSGKGDLIVWATDGTRFNIGRLKAGERLNLVLDKDATFTGEMDFDLVPPVPGGALPEVPVKAAELNEQRKMFEDSVRLSYVNTFLTAAQAGEICRELNMEDKASGLLVKSRGNHRTITGFLRSVQPEMRGRAVDMLWAIAEKDLHDITADVLEDHLYHTVGDINSPLFVDYVLNPRIESEMLRPYKQEIRGLLTEEQKESYIADPHNLEKWLGKEFADDRYNPGGFRQSAVSSLKYATADALNRDIAFVAVCRSLGIPARIDPVSHTTQYADSEGKWIDVTFGEVLQNDSEDTGKGILEIIDAGTLKGRQPKYYSQFSISEITQGAPKLLEFEDFETVESINRRGQHISPGQYVMVTGQRLADGSVLSHVRFFNIGSDKPVLVPLTVRQDTAALQVIGTLDAELTYQPLEIKPGVKATAEKRSILSTTGRGYYGLGIVLPGHEPSAHALNDISRAAKELEATGRKLLILFPDAESATNFKPEDFGDLPANVVSGIDDGTISKALSDGLELSDESETADISLQHLPVFVIADSFNRIVFSRLGYTINLGETLAGILQSLE